MRGKLLRVLLFKFAGLWALWYLCFSPPHRPLVDARAVGRQLALAPAVDLVHGGAGARGSSHD